MIRKIILFILLIQQTVNPEKILDKDLVKWKLSEMTKKDQEFRLTIDINNISEEAKKKILEIDKDNTCHLEKIIEEFGWLKISEFDQETDHNAWLIVQHSSDLIFQKKILKILETLYPLKETDSSNFAYLYDRIAMKEKRAQKYGTQGDIIENKWILYPTEDIENLDNRRLKMGLCSYKEYLNLLNKVYNLESN